MEFLGNFRNFDFSRSLVPLLFIMPGKWNVYLLGKVDHAEGWTRAILGGGTCRFSKRPYGFNFYADKIQMEVKKNGIVQQILFEQASFEMLALAGDGSHFEDELSMSNTNVAAGMTLIIEHWEVTWK